MMTENLQQKIQTQYLNNRNHEPKKLNPTQEAIQRDKERIARTEEQRRIAEAAAEESMRQAERFNPL